jgi:hypothetical protein
MIGQPGGHRGCYGSPFLGCTMSLLGWERRVEFRPCPTPRCGVGGPLGVAQSAMGTTEMIISKRQRQLIFQIDPLLRKSVHLAPQSSGMLSNGQMIALDAIGVDHRTHGRCSQKGSQLLLSALHPAGRDTDQMWPFVFFDDHRVTQVGRRPLPRKWKTSASALPRRRIIFTVHLQEGIGVMREVIAGTPGGPPQPSGLRAWARTASANHA